MVKWKLIFVSVLLLISWANQIGSFPLAFIGALEAMGHIYNSKLIATEMYGAFVVSETGLMMNQLVEISKAIGKLEENVSSWKFIHNRL